MLYCIQHINVYQAFNFRKINNLIVVSARFCEIYFILQALPYTLLTLWWMWQPSFNHATVDLSFQIEICNLDRTKSSFLAKSLYKKSNFHHKLSYKVLSLHQDILSNVLQSLIKYLLVYPY